jgi:hypothetical protein
MSKFQLCICLTLSGLGLILGLKGLTDQTQNKGKDYTVRIVASGDTGGNGIYSYGNHKVDNQDHFLTADYKVIMYQADGSSKPLKWNENYGVFTTDLQVHTTENDKGDMVIALYRQEPSVIPCPNADPNCTEKPIYGVYAETWDSAGKLVCIVELWHYGNVNLGGFPRMHTAILLHGIEDNGCVNTGPDNRLPLDEIPATK